MARKKVVHEEVEEVVHEEVQPEVKAVCKNCDDSGRECNVCRAGKDVV